MNSLRDEVTLEFVQYFNGLFERGSEDLVRTTIPLKAQFNLTSIKSASFSCW